MHRYRVGQIFRPPSVAESAANADSVESHRRSPAKPQDLAPVGQDIVIKTPTAGIEARDDMTIYSALCTRCIEIDGEDNTKTLVETDEERRIYNLELAAVPGDSFVNTALTLHGTRHAMPTVGLVRCMLAEDHPGRGVKFTVWPGTWCQNEDKWRFDCENTAAVWDAIDWFYAVTEIIPDKYAQGWFTIKPSKYGRDGIIYDCIVTDCDSDASCANHKLPCTDVDR